MIGKRISRRKALALGAGVGAFTIVPSHVLRGAVPPSDKMNLAFMGVGMAGRNQINDMASENIVALCDVDWREGGGRMVGTPAAMSKKFPSAKRYVDWRVMLEEMSSSIDGVVVSSTDHTHAHVTITAMQMGKHVFCEKPLAHSVHETRAMMAAEKKYNKVTTQTCVQGHASEDCRSIVEWVRDGAIGDVREAHFYECDKPRPGRPPRDYYGDLQHIHDEVAVPPELDWDLWIGPAPDRPYNPMYHPNRWRYWLDFGTSKLGDHGPHYLDPICWALDLGLPETIEADTDAGWDAVRDQHQIYPQFAEVRYGFPARGDKPPVTVTWHHSDEMPPLPKWWKAEDEAPTGGGYLVGSKGAIMFGPIYASKPGALQQVKLIPEELDRDYKRPAQTIPRVGNHCMEWVECAKAGKPASAPFSYGGNISLICLLGDIAILEKGKTLHYDAGRGRFTDDEANHLFERRYREGWELPS